MVRFADGREVGDEVFRAQVRTLIPKHLKDGAHGDAVVESVVDRVLKELPVAVDPSQWHQQHARGLIREEVEKHIKKNPAGRKP